MSKDNIYVKNVKKLWDGVLELGDIGLKLFGAIFIITTILYPVFKIGFTAVTGIELP